MAWRDLVILTWIYRKPVNTDKIFMHTPRTMDPISNPFTPGAGTQPPELAGREALREALRVAMQRARHGRAFKSVILLGLRGVGKTVLLDRMRADAEQAGLRTLRIEAPEGRSLPAILAPQLRSALLRLSLADRARELAGRALRALTGFVRVVKLRFQDVEMSLEGSTEPGLADNGDLASDLTDLLQAVGETAQAAGTVIVMFIDELQYVPEAQLAALITALHRGAQRNLPIMLVGAGLPQLRGQLGQAKSYAERMFEFPTIGALGPEDARRAIRQPIEDAGARIDEQALDGILRQTQGYPYFLQEWGKHAWDVASGSPLRAVDVDHASALAVSALDANFFGVRFDRLAPSEKRYLRAMAELGPGPHRSGDIAQRLGREVTSLGPTRAKLIAKGMVWSPTHGDTAFTVPLFDAYMRRVMPDL